MSQSIQHVHIDKLIPGNTLPVLNVLTKYVVFWFQDIPIDGYFVEKNGPRQNLINELFFEQKVLSLLHKRSHIGTIENDTSSNLAKEVGISVVVCTRNRSQHLRRCLQSLMSQLFLPKQILVIDNAPEDESTENVVREFPSITYYKEARLGLDIARNSGAILSTESIIAYTDDDVIVHKLWCCRIWEMFLNNNISGLTGLILAQSLDTESQLDFEKYWSFNKGFKDVIFTNEFLINGLAAKVWNIGAGANMAFRKESLEQIGYFDERLDVGAAGCNGDSEVWYRLLAEGKTIHYCTKAVVFHEHRKTLKALRKQVYNYMRGHVAAALIQHSQNTEGLYKKYVHSSLPIYYLKVMKAGFPYRSSRFRTILWEFAGMISGIIFFYRNRKVSRLSEQTKNLITACQMKLSRS